MGFLRDLFKKKDAPKNIESSEVEKSPAQHRHDEERRKLIREAIKNRLTLQEALIFVERRTNQAGISLTPAQHISVMELLRKRREGQKVMIALGDEVPIATVSMLIISLVSFGDRSLIVTDSPQLTRDFFKKGKVSSTSGLRASDVTQQCSRKLVDADSLFESRDFQTLEESIFDLNNIVVMAHPTHRAIRGQHNEIYNALKSIGDVIKVAPGVLISHRGQYFS